MQLRRRSGNLTARVWCQTVQSAVSVSAQVALFWGFIIFYARATGVTSGSGRRQSLGSNLSPRLGGGLAPISARAPAGFEPDPFTPYSVSDVFSKFFGVKVVTMFMGVIVSPPELVSRPTDATVSGGGLILYPCSCFGWHLSRPWSHPTWVRV